MIAWRSDLERVKAMLVQCGRERQHYADRVAVLQEALDATRDRETSAMTALKDASQAVSDAIKGGEDACFRAYERLANEQKARADDRERDERAAKTLTELVARGYDQTNFVIQQLADLKREGFGTPRDRAPDEPPPEMTEEEQDIAKIRSVIAEYMPLDSDAAKELYRQSVRDLKANGNIRDVIKTIHIGYTPVPRDDEEEVFPEEERVEVTV